MWCSDSGNCCTAEPRTAVSTLADSQKVVITQGRYTTVLAVQVLHVMPSALSPGENDSVCDQLAPVDVVFNDFCAAGVSNSRQDKL